MQTADCAASSRASSGAYLANRAENESFTMRCEQVTRTEDADMFLGLALVLFVIWILCLLVFKVTVAAVHLIVVIAVIAFIVHFVRGRATPTP
jgi:Flp pilus assembly protein TadB